MLLPRAPREPAGEPPCHTRQDRSDTPPLKWKVLTPSATRKQGGSVGSDFFHGIRLKLPSAFLRFHDIQGPLEALRHLICDGSRGWSGHAQLALRRLSFYGSLLDRQPRGLRAFRAGLPACNDFNRPLPISRVLRDNLVYLILSAANLHGSPSDCGSDAVCDKVVRDRL